MNENSTNDFYRDFFAVLAGVLSAIITGWIIKFAFLGLFHFDPLNEFSVNENYKEFVIQLAVGGWLFVSSLVGGWICAIIAGKNDLSHIIISSLVVLALYFLLGGTGIFKERSFVSWALLLAIPAGYFIGEWMGWKNKAGES